MRFDGTLRGETGALRRLHIPLIFMHSGLLRRHCFEVQLEVLKSTFVKSKDKKVFWKFLNAWSCLVWNILVCLSSPVLLYLLQGLFIPFFFFPKYHLCGQHFCKSHHCPSGSANIYRTELLAHSCAFLYTLLPQTRQLNSLILPTSAPLPKLYLLEQGWLGRAVTCGYIVIVALGPSATCNTSLRDWKTLICSGKQTHIVSQLTF